ncbi:cytochrome c oxidase assembly protein, partial [Salinivibrio kushneri]
MATKSTRSARRLLLLAVVMFGFAFALVPLYDVFCEVTGIN